MKRCPACRRDYFDDSLSYCLDDGTALLEGPALENEPATALIPKSDTTEDPSRPIRNGSAPETPIQRAVGQKRIKTTFILGVAVGTLLLAAVGIGRYWYFGRTDSHIDSIAIMPFVNASGSAELEYLSDGIAETLISSLSQLPSMSVKPRSSVFRYKGKDTDAPTLGKELNVQAILTGTVVQRGNDIGLHVELVDSATDRVLWSKDYLRPLSNLISLQSEIAREVSFELKTKLSGTDERQLTKNYTTNPEAYKFYLKGRFHWNKRTKNDLFKAIDYYRQAVSLDPNYALAYAALSDTYAILGGYDITLARPELGERARENALRALALDDSLPQAHISLGLVLRSVDHNFAEAEVRFRRGLELEPNNADGYNYLAYMQMAFGKFDEAEANYKRAVELEPTSPNHTRNYAAFLMYARRYDESIVQLNKAIDLEPNFTLAHLTLSNVYQMQGRYLEAVEAYAKARELTGDLGAAVLMRESFAKGGWKGFITGLNEKKWFEEFRPHYIRAGQLVSIGDKEGAFALLEQAYEQRDGFIILLNVDPRFDALRDDDRFKVLVKKIGVG